MALTYPEYAALQPSQTKLTDLLDLWNQGVAQGKADRYEREAPQQFANAAAPLSEFGLTMPPDQMRALFANPNTRPFALQMVQEASARRAIANDSLLRQRLEPQPHTPPQTPQSAAAPPANTSPMVPSLMPTATSLPTASSMPTANSMPAASVIPTIVDDDGYNALQSGSIFRAPDGSVRRKP